MLGEQSLYDRKAAWEKAFSSLVSEEDMQKGEDMVKRYGVVAVFIGGITPLPDFLFGISCRIYPYVIAFVFNI